MPTILRIKNMGKPAKQKATYDDLYNVPDNMIGEIIDGDLYTMPRPSPKHAKVTSDLGVVIGAPYRFGQGSLSKHNSFG